ncbi:MAG TPA: periplasmic heavy metal sensor [Gemmatimonadales bacterium]|nr:periplasmic heavy metal sensor [Gemmatimonadales bacterium]
MFSQSRTWAAALLVAVFLAGGATGWAVSRATLVMPPRGGGPDALTAYLARRLNLDAAQQDAVRAVLTRHHTEMQAIMSSVRPRLDSLRNTVRAEITAQLTPPQRERYARLLKELEHQRDERSHRDSTHSPSSPN